MNTPSVIDTAWQPLASGCPPDWASGWGQDRFGLWTEIALETGRDRPVTQRLRWIPPGRFWMGSPESEQGRWEDEGPRHEVILSRGYWLFDTPCTQALWEAVMGENPSRFKGLDRPVESVSWDQVQAFIEQVNRRIPGLALALPSEAQWEYACRAGAETATYAGDLDLQSDNDASVLDPIAWYEANSDGQTHPVAQKRSNPWGLYDMLGNVWEWCLDDWRNYSDESQTDPTGSTTGGERAIRGGSWYSEARDLRAAFRLHDRRGYRLHLLGFRCARVQA